MSEQERLSKQVSELRGHLRTAISNACFWQHKGKGTSSEEEQKRSDQLELLLLLVEGM